MKHFISTLIVCSLLISTSAQTMAQTVQNEHSKNNYTDIRELVEKANIVCSSKTTQSGNSINILISTSLGEAFIIDAETLIGSPSFILAHQMVRNDERGGHLKGHVTHVFILHQPDGNSVNNEIVVIDRYKTGEKSSEAITGKYISTPASGVDSNDSRINCSKFEL